MRQPTRALLLVIAVAACEDKATPLDLGGPPSVVTSVSGDGQRGSVNEVLPVPLVVRVTDDQGNPNAGVEVRWAAKNGAVSAAVDTTDDAGQSAVLWKLPDAPGVDSVIAVAPGIGNVVFSATVQPTEGNITFRFLDAGGYHACGITTTEVLLCWGYGADGQLGNGATSRQLYPTAIPGDFRYRRISGGYYHSCAFTLASNAYCWGNNSDGRLGGGGVADQSEVPVKVLAGLDTLVLSDTLIFVPGINLSVQVLQAGELHTCGIDLAQHVWCWGGDPEGGVGVGNFGPGDFVNVAVPVLTNELFKSVVVGGLHTCAITTSGGGRCWGYNIAGQLGNGGNSSSGTPVTVSGGFTFRTDGAVIFRSPDPDFPLPPGPFMAAGYDHSCGITTGNQALCWGLNQDGQLGDDDTPNSNTPVPVAGGHAFVAITAGLRHTCALDTTGAAWCWGANDLGQLGRAGVGSRIPVAVEGGLKFAYIKAGELFTCGVTSDGVAWCWGDNEYGQLGNGTTASSNVPIKVAFQP